MAPRLRGARAHATPSCEDAQRTKKHLPNLLTTFGSRSSGRASFAHVGGGPPKSFVKAFGPRGTDPAAWKEIGRALSPIYHVTPQVPPVLIYHGDADTLVPLEQSEWFVTRVRAAGGTIELVVRHGKQHGWLTMLWDIRPFADWFDGHLRPQRG